MVDEIVLKVLRALPYCRELTDSELDWLAQRARLRTLEPHEELLTEGGESGALYVLISGRARIFKRSPDGRQQVLAILQGGDSFNEVPVFDDGPDPANVETMEESVLLVLERHHVRELAARSPRFALAILRTFARRLRGLTSLVQSLAFSDVAARVAQLLYQLALQDRRPGPGGPVITRTMTVQEMGSMVGSVREVVSRALARFENDGLIGLERDRILIKDLEGLRRAAE